MSGHSPGPWLRDGSHIYAPDKACIAQVFNPGRKATDYPLEWNAVLMTAAPELLSALIAYSNWDYEVQSAKVNGESIYSFAELTSMREDARKLGDAAIAKATQP